MHFKQVALLASLIVLICAIIFFGKPAYESVRELIDGNNGISEISLLDKKSLTLNVGNKKIIAEIVSTQADLQKGLGGRPYLQDNTGMFFIFPKSDSYGIWMKDMLFPIDVLWLDKGLKVVHIVGDMEPSSYPRVIYKSPVDAMYVLELSKGDISASGIKLGDRISVEK